jgi:hypothetical protein
VLHHVKSSTSYEIIWLYASTINIKINGPQFMLQRGMTCFHLIGNDVFSLDRE